MPGTPCLWTRPMGECSTVRQKKKRPTPPVYREASSKELPPAQQEAVRDHMQALAAKLGLAQPTRGRRTTFAQSKTAASPRERKVWALWHQLYRDGKLRDNSAAALNAWVQRTVGVAALRFATGPMLDTLIEALKAWDARKELRHE